MDREFTYTKKKLQFILEHILEDDVRGRAEYLSDERAEEGFEKRAVLEFLLWFLEQGFPDDAAFPYRYTDLEQDYPESAAQRISQGKGWAARQVGEDEDGGGPGDGNVILGDFKRPR